jgi:hypothetical protein
MKKGREQADMRDHGAALAEAAERLPRVVVASGDCEFLRADAVARLRDAWLRRFPDGDTLVVRGAGEAKQIGRAHV